MRTPILTLVGFTAALVGGAGPLRAATLRTAPLRTAPLRVAPAAPQDTAIPASEVPLRDSLRTAIRRLATLERGMLRSIQAGDSAAVSGADQQRAAVQSTLDSLLERVVLGTAWGPAELDRLRARYPGSRVLDTFAARLRLRQDEPAAALELLDRLIGRDPSQAEIHVLRARALEALGREDDAWLAWLRALDLEPEAEAPFRGLLELARREDAAPDAMDRLLTHVRRLRRMAADDRAQAAVLRDREVELLQRMGRLEEARAVQDTTGGGRP
jgi:tetratricopeptide (TPR) repeat protein